LLAKLCDLCTLFDVEHLANELWSWFVKFTQICEDLGMGIGSQLGRHVDDLTGFGGEHDDIPYRIEIGVCAVRIALSGLHNRWDYL